MNKEARANQLVFLFVLEVRPREKKLKKTQTTCGNLLKKERRGGNQKKLIIGNLRKVNRSPMLPLKEVVGK